MGWLRDQFEDWKYLISSGNTTSRGFYIFVSVMVFAIVAILLVTGGIWVYGNFTA